MVMLALIWTVQKKARKSTAHNEFRTPPSVLPLMEGGGGSGVDIKVRAKIYGLKYIEQIYGS
jgi:hypothetical protein